jgi:hypothetical protein
MPSSDFTSPSAVIIETWKNLYKRNSKLTVILSIALGLGAMAAALVGFYQDKKKDEELARKRMENLSYNQQVDALNSVQASLNNLIEFVNLQKAKLKESEDIVNNLKSEQAKLQPVVEADRKTVEALLSLQAEKASHTNILWERTIGFTLGFLASILASVVYGIVRFLLGKRKTRPLTTG